MTPEEYIIKENNGEVDYKELLRGCIAYYEERLRSMEETLTTINKVVTAISRYNDDITNSSLS